MVKSIDALGYETIYRYGLRDTTFTYPDKVTNALGQYVDFKYDIGTGNLLWSEKEGIRTSYVYDTFGRLTKEILPYDDENLPTKTTTYYFDGTAPEIIKVSQRESAGNYTTTYLYYDGMAQVVQIKQAIENNLTVTKNIFYDAQDRVKYEQNPYFENYVFTISTPSTSVNKTYYTYDVLDRVTKVTNPDGTYKETVFNKWNISDYDENQHRHDYLLDSSGRITNVLEYNVQPLLNNKSEVYNTTYSYDVNDNLIKIVDNEGNEFKFYYDSLGRKIKLDDPDLGIWQYGYDSNNNLITQNDSKGNVIVLSYDSLNRIQQKNSTDVNISFTYDAQYWGTLTNLTMNNIVYKYAYDKRMRPIKVEKFVNGRSSGKSLDYDSGNRLIQQALPSTDLEYYYNKQGKVYSITNFIRNSTYSAFGSITSRGYESGLNAQFTYNTQNNRLTNITAGNVQNLKYTYDNVGNILSIKDTIAKRNNTMTYDALDRLATTSINTDLYQYEYDPIGNIRRIVNGNVSRRLNYNSRIPHAASQVIEHNLSAAGIYGAKDLDLGTKNRTFEFFLLKERLANATNVIWSMNFGQNSISSSIPLNISIPILVIVENNYSNGGTYLVNVSTATDANTFTDQFGVSAQSVALITSNHSISYIEFTIDKNIRERATNAVWNCSSINTSSTLPFNITNDTMVLIEYNYTTPGDKNVLCSISSSDGSGNKSTDFEIKGLKIENYDLISLDTNQKVAMYEVRNYFNPLLVNITTASDANSMSRLANISSDGFVMALIEMNYSTDGNKQVSINALSNAVNSSYRDTFKIKALEINNYDRYELNNTNRILVFDVKNQWPANLSVKWNLTDPLVNYSAYLNKSQFVMVIVEQNYTSQGRHEPEVKAYSNGFLTSFKDRFDIFIVHLLDLQILKQSISSTVTELVAKSHSGNKSLSWKYDTGRETINSTRQFAVNESKDVMIIIESNYTVSSITRVNATINYTTTSDSIQGVVIT